MKLVTEPTNIEGAMILKGNRFEDERGTFEELFHVEQFKTLGLPTAWAQDNISTSVKGVLRGLHLQKKNPQAKLVRSVYGVVYDVILDLRPASPTYKKWQGFVLTSAVPLGLFVPEGCAHGFYCMSPIALVQYKCTTLYDRESDGGVHWKKSGIDWPFESDEEPLVSAKDQLLPSADDYLSAEE